VVVSRGGGEPGWGLVDREPGGGVLDVERWAELRREHFVCGVSIKELVRRSGLARNTVRAALRCDVPPGFRCPERSSKLDPFKEEIHRLLWQDPRLPGVRVRELIEPLGFVGGKTIVDDYRARCARCLCARGRFGARSIGRARCASGICGSRLVRCRSGTARPAAAGSWSPAWATRALAPGRWSSARRRRTCCGG
jgi:hypothetical protein